MRFPISQLVAFFLLSVSLLSAQTVAPAASQSQAADSQSKENQATVYIYRYKQFVGSALSPSVYCDDIELARMTNGRYFAAKLAAGKHTFYSNDKQSGIDVDLKSGEDYYIRVEIAAGMMKGHGRLVLVAAEQGGYEIKKLKPLDADKVKDSQHVVVADLETK